MLLDCLLSPELCFRLPIYTVCCNRYADLQSFVNFAFCCSWDLPLLLLMQLVVFFANVAFLFSVANVDLLDVKLDIFVQKKCPLNSLFTWNIWKLLPYRWLPVAVCFFSLGLSSSLFRHAKPNATRKTSRWCTLQLQKKLWCGKRGL